MKSKLFCLEVNAKQILTSCQYLKTEHLMHIFHPPSSTSSLPLECTPLTSLEESNCEIIQTTSFSLAAEQNLQRCENHRHRDYMII